MEETQNITVITICLGSHLLQEMQISIYQTDDRLIQTLQIKNYTSKAIKVNKPIERFYCTVNSLDYEIQDQFQCDFSQALKENEKPTLQKEFQGFGLSLSIQYTKQAKTLQDEQNPHRAYDYLSCLALRNLKKLQKKILKKIEVQQLKRPIKPKCKFTVASNESTKGKANLRFTRIYKQKFSSQKKLGKRDVKKLETVCVKPIQPEADIENFDENNNDDNDNDNDNDIDDNYQEEEMKSKRGGKHKTLSYKMLQMFEENCDNQGQFKENKAEQLPMYDLILKIFNNSQAQKKQIVKRHRNGFLRHSYNDFLQSATHKDLKMQNEVLNVINSSTDYTWFTPKQSKVDQKVVKNIKNSPYKVSTINFRKRKVF